ncbi:MAG: cytochrome C oxidase subunit IV family protein [Deltaproteobacteria bacterium]|nr:cytochrome C oxidase subunit IV family protein [Deltaproteobacteria bacterium]
MGSHNDSNEHKPHDHILSNKLGLKVLIALLILTVITIIASRIDFGALNFPIAMLIASVKALMVVLIFMGLKYDDNENRVIFFSSFVFVAIFILLTAADIFTRGDFQVKGNFLMQAQSSTKFKKPWISSPEILAHGKKIYTEQCVICHGANGFGDGVAAAALNPKPRNFHEDAGWKNGRSASRIFGTLLTGLGSMPSFKETLPSSDDRWAVTQYILTLDPTKPLDDTEADLKKVGFDPAKGDYGKDEAADVVKRKIPIDFAIDRYLGK